MKTYTYKEYIDLWADVQRRFSESEEAPNTVGLDLDEVSAACHAAETARASILEASCERGIPDGCDTCIHADCPKDGQPCSDCRRNWASEWPDEDFWEWRWPCPPLTGDTYAEIAEKAGNALKCLEEAEDVLRGCCGACAHHDNNGGEQPCKACKCRQLNKGLLDNWEWRWPLQRPVTPTDLQLRVSAGSLLPCAIRMAQELSTAKAALHGECAACRYAPDDDSDDSDCPPECTCCSDGSNWLWRWGRTH